MILLFKLLEPDSAIDFSVAFGASYGGRKKSSFVADHVVVQWQSLFLVIFGPY